MIDYQTYTPKSTLPAKATARPMAAYDLNHDDVLRSLSGAGYDIAAAKAAAEYANQYQQSQQASALSGLRQMSEEQGQSQSLYNTRLQNMMGAAGLLQGLFS
jgi:hypothetical protein